MKEIKLRDNTLKWTMVVYVDYLYSEYCSKIWVEVEEKNWLLWQCNKIDWIAFIYIKDKKDLPTLIHEILHWAYYILDYKGIDITEELLCFYQEYFFKEYLKKVK